MSQSPHDKTCNNNQDQDTTTVETSISSNSTNVIEKSVVKKIDFSIESLLRIPYQEPQSQSKDSDEESHYPNHHSAIEFREKLNFLTFANCFHLQNKRRRTGREGNEILASSSVSGDNLEQVDEEREIHIDNYDNKYNSNEDEEEEEEESQCKSEGDEQSCDERGVEKELEIGHHRIVNNNQEETETLSETEESTQKEFSWLYCSRFKPPKLPRSKKRGGCKRYGRGPRIPFAPHQITVLETAFKKSQYLSTDCISRLAETLFLSENRVKIWFQNRRARFRRENSDQDISNMLLDKRVSTTEPSLNSPSKGKPTSPTKSSISLNNNLSSPSDLNGSRKRVHNNHNNANNNTTTTNNHNNNNSSWTTKINHVTSPNTLSFFPFQLERPHNMFLNAETHFHNEKNNSANSQQPSSTSPYNISGSRELSSEFIHSTINANAHFNRILYGTSTSAFAPIRR